MAFTCQHQMRAPVSRAGPARRACTKVMATNVKMSAAKASLAAAGAAMLLASSSPALAVTPSQSTLAPQDPVATIAADTSAGPGDKGPFTKLLDSIPSIFPKVNEDPFGADRAQEKTVADTKRSIPIPTEQEAVAPEAFPNPSEPISPRPPVLAAAEGDEHLGDNAGQFQGLDASGRQELIDKQSPAQSPTN